MFKKKFLTLILSALFLAIGIGGFYYLVKTKPPNVMVKPPEKAWTVATEPIILQNLSPTLTLYGRVESPYMATLRAALNAEVLEVAVLEGQAVKRGQLLIQLDGRDVELLVAQRQADWQEIQAAIDSENHIHASNQANLPKEKTLLQLAQKAVKRADELERRHVGSQSALDEAKSAVERQKLAVNNRQLEINNHSTRLAQLQARQTRAQALLEQAQLDLNRTQITAPSTGIVAQVMVAPGDRVRLGDALIRVYDRETLEVRAQIPSAYQRTAYDSLAAGTKLRAQAMIGNQMLQLVLQRLAGEVKLDSGGIDGLFRVNQGKNLLRLGQFVNLHLLLPPQRHVVAVPFEAIYDNQRVYKLSSEGRMVKVEIKRLGEHTKPNGETRVLIHSPQLTMGEQLVVTQLPNAVEGLKVISSQNLTKEQQPVQ
jgi:multidrug efflux pump subunit AcrA (membrane-fusion protein)